MKASMGSVFTYNIIIVFLLIVFSLLAATISYSKAFRVNSKILNAIEKYEGYNELSDTEINQVLETLGYQIGSGKCSKKDGKTSVDKLSSKYDYCVYYEQIDSRHYKYGVTTYITLDLPLVNKIKLPVYTETERIYYFTNK